MKKIVSICSIVVLLLLTTLLVPVQKIELNTILTDGKPAEVEEKTEFAFVPIYKLGGTRDVEGVRNYPKTTYTYDFHIHLMMYLTITTSCFLLINLTDKKSNMSKPL